MARITIKWHTRNEETRRKIRDRFSIPDYVTVNGWSPAEIADADMELLRECQRRGLLSILPHQWRKNGAQFTFISRK